jgi:hypothetical protein
MLYNFLEKRLYKIIFVVFFIFHISCIVYQLLRFTIATQIIFEILAVIRIFNRRK